MYSLLKHNNSVIIKTKCIVQGDNLCRLVVRKHCLLCRPVGASPILASGLLHSSGARRHPLDVRILLGVTCDTGQWGYCPPSVVLLSSGGFRGFRLGTPLRVDPLKPSSRVEETVTALKEKAKTPPTTKEVVPTKKTLKQRVVDELLHYYHGFRLLLIDINVSRKLLWRILQGKHLSRRENKLLIRTVGDLFRIVPFSVFIIVPFMELLLPVFIKFFPGMLPSTFQTATEKEDKMKQALKVKLEMAKFLQKTLDDMAVSSKGHSSQAAKDFATFFGKTLQRLSSVLALNERVLMKLKKALYLQIRTSGEMTTSEEIMKFSKLFEDEITLDSLPRPQLMALCRVLEMNPIGTTNFLRFQLRLKLRSLIADDMMIQKEGVDSLSQSELQAACRARGMRALGVSEERLKAQLSQWLDLSLIKKVPPSLLLLSQAFMLPETTTTSEKLAATISALPDVIGTQTKAVIGEREGKVDNKTKIEVVKEELAKIKEERKEQLEEEKKHLALKEAEGKEELMVDQAPPLLDKAIMLEPALRAVVQDIKRTSITDRLSHDELTTKDLEALEKALDALGKDQNKLLVEKEELQELRQEMAEYQEDIADLQKVSTIAGKEAEVKESRAAQLLFRKVNKMISKMDNVLGHLEQKEKSIKDKDILESPAQPLAPSEEVLKIEDLISTIHRLQDEPDKNRLQRISEVLSKMDADRDGIVRVDSVLKVLEIIGNENVKLSKKQIDELIELIDKEEAIELDDQIVKALNKKKEVTEKAKMASTTEMEKGVSATSGGRISEEVKSVSVAASLGGKPTPGMGGGSTPAGALGGAGGGGSAPAPADAGKPPPTSATPASVPPPFSLPAAASPQQQPKELR